MTTANQDRLHARPRKPLVAASADRLRDMIFAAAPGARIGAAAKIISRRRSALAATRGFRGRACSRSWFAVVMRGSCRGRVLLYACN